MTIYCKLCDHKIRSEKPPIEAQEHVLKQMGQHLAVHQKQAQGLAQDLLTISQLLATYLMIQKYVRIPPEETELQKSFEENEQSLLSLFGVNAQPQD